MDALNFGQMGSDLKCECGKHAGIGEWTPEDRAANYAFIRDKISSAFDGHRKAYLDSWEAEHGKAKYEMVFSHVSTAAQAKMLNSTEGKSINRPILVGSEQRPMYSQQKRSWHDAA